MLIAPTVRGPTPLEQAKADELAADGYLAIVLDHYGKAERDLGDRARELMNGLLADRALPAGRRPTPLRPAPRSGPEDDSLRAFSARADACRSRRIQRLRYGRNTTWSPDSSGW